MADVSVPFWLFAIVAVFALVGFIDRIFTPAVRWFFRRQVNAVIEEINQRLPLKIAPFKLTRRQVLIDRLSNDPEVLKAVDEEAREEGVPLTVMADRARDYAREIVPSFNAYAYFRFGTRAAKLLATALYRVRLGYADREALAAIPADASVVFVMNHRSNMDYVLVTYLASDTTTLSYAVGEWARVIGLQQLVRAMGAYFIRRKSRGLLYRRVLARYVQMATEAGVPQAVFPEGGLSTDGRLQSAKRGILAYIAEAYRQSLSGQGRDVVFIPVGINYDRVLEDRLLITTSSEKRSGFRQFLGGVRFVAHNLRLRLTGRWFRFGYAVVNFGKPVSLAAFAGAAGAVDVDQLADHLMDAVGRHVPVTPVALVAEALLQHAPLDRLALKTEVSARIDALSSNSVPVHVPRENRDYAVDAGLRMLLLRRLVMDNEGLLSPVEEERELLSYYARSIAHLG